MTVRPHDALFRSAFEDPEHASAELRHVLPEALAVALDWSTLRTEPGAYVDSQLADRYSDGNEYADAKSEYVRGVLRRAEP